MSSWIRESGFSFLLSMYRTLLVSLNETFGRFRSPRVGVVGVGDSSSERFRLSAGVKEGICAMSRRHEQQESTGKE